MVVSCQGCGRRFDDEQRAVHPDEPAEGGEDEEDAPGADRPDNAA